MSMRGVVLSEINDKRLLERIVKKEVYDARGSKIGIIWKIYIAKKTKQPLKVVVKRITGDILEISPDRLRISGKKIILMNDTDEGAIAILEKLWEIADELKKIKNELLLLGERHLILKELSYEEYLKERKKLERQRLMLKLEAYTLLDTLNHLITSEGLKLSEEDEKRLLESLDILRNSFPIIPAEKLRELF
ncbi:MAG: PRC-barrel domain-containing protein [Infirmifilum sp.]